MPVPETGNAITVSESHDVDVYSNRLTGNNSGVHLLQKMCRGSDNPNRARNFYLDRVLVVDNHIGQRDYGTRNSQWPLGKAVKFAVEKWSGSGPCPIPYADGRQDWALADWYLENDIRFEGNSFELLARDGRPDDTALVFWDYDHLASPPVKAELALARWLEVVTGPPGRPLSNADRGRWSATVVG